MAITLYSAAFAATFMHFIPSVFPHKPTTGPFLDVKDCLNEDCPAIDENSLYPRVAQAFKDFSKENSTLWKYYWNGIKKDPEYLRMRKNDPRQKCLFASASYELEGALNPKYISPLVKALGENSDIKYVVANSVKDLCRYIKEAGELGKLTNVIIEAHGNSETIAISAPDGENDSLNENSDFENCFKGLDPSGKIILISSHTGSDKKNIKGSSLAQKIATLAKREVIAPIGDVHPRRIEISRNDALQIFHPLENNSSLNLFQLFRPIYEKCQRVVENILHPREKQALSSIKGNLLKKGLISKDAGFERTQDYLRFCQEDPKKKLLFLSAEEDWNGALNPVNNEEILGTLADYYDMKFKVVSKYEEVCEEIKKSSENKNLEYVILNMHGNPKGMDLSNPDTDLENSISVFSKDLSACFSGLNNSGKILLLSCKTAQPGKDGPKDNIAGMISEIAKKTVVAPKEIIYSSVTKITEKEPLKLYHGNKQTYFESLLKNPHNVYTEFKQEKQN